MNKTHSSYDIVVIGGGHNSLVAASYLAQAGLSVLILERRDHIGGATVSKQVFNGVEARLSEYSYLISLLSPIIIKDLGLTIETKQRSTASYTPSVKNGILTGLMISNISPTLTEESFLQFTGNSTEYQNYKNFLEMEALVADKIWPSLLEPLKTRSYFKDLFKTDQEKQAWDIFIERPLGQGIEERFQSDPVRGLIFTDAKIGVFTHPHDKTLLQNRTFLYHIIGNGTGEWRVPMGGMGEVVGQLEKAARSHSVEIISNATVTTIEPDSLSPCVTYQMSEKEFKVKAKFILCGAAPKTLNKLLGNNSYASAPGDEGSVFKINMILKNLPKLADKSHSSNEAFTGTFHINEGYDQMKTSYAQADKGLLPHLPPGEMYCHTLTDDTIFSPQLRSTGCQTLTLFGLDMPYRLFVNDHQQVKKIAQERYLQGINQYLDEPIEKYIATDIDGRPCIESKSPLDIESELAMPLGNIFHNQLSWPFVENEDEAGSWGVEVGYPNIFLCGSGAKRGGCVSGIPGHNAAMKVLGLLRK